MIRFIIISISIFVHAFTGQAQTTKTNNLFPGLEADLVSRWEGNIEKSRCYFVDLKITNKNDSTFRFWVNYSCYLFNVILNGKGFEIVPNDCFSDYPILITLKKNESANFPILLKANKSADFYDIKMGFVVIPESQYTLGVGSDLTRYIVEVRESGKQIIWIVNDQPAYLFRPILEEQVKHNQ